MSEPGFNCNDELLHEMIDMYNNGKTYYEISLIVNKSRRWVGAVLKGHVESRPNKRRKTTYDTIKWDTKDERDNNIISMYCNEHIGAYLISKRLGISKRTVFKVLESKGIKTRPSHSKGKINKCQIPEIIRRYNKGESSASIAKDYGVVDDTIRYYIDDVRNSGDSQSAIPPYIQDEVIRLATEEKLSSYKISQKFGWDYQNVQKFLQRKGVSVGSFTKEWKNAVQRGISSSGSSLENKLADIMDNIGLRYNRQAVIDDFRYDFSINNVLIEVQGSYWHTKAQRRQRDAYKRKLAYDNGRKLVIIWDYELNKPELVKNRLLNAISKKEFNFKDSRVKAVDWAYAKELLNEFHYQGCGRSGHCIGAMYNGKLIGVAVFAKPTRLETAAKQNICYNNILELTRLVIHPEYQSWNFASWFISKCTKSIKTSHPQISMLISFADLTFGHSGTVYKASNWEFDGYSEASYWYYYKRENRIYHKKTIWNRARDDNMTEKEYYIKHNLIKVWGQEKARYIYRI